MIESLLQAEVAQVVGAEFVAQEAGELLVLLEKRMFPVRSENMMAVLDLIDHRGQFAAQSLIQADAEDLADAVCRQPPQTDFATALEDVVDREGYREGDTYVEIADGGSTNGHRPKLRVWREAWDQPACCAYFVLTRSIGRKCWEL